MVHKHNIPMIFSSRPGDLMLAIDYNGKVCLFECCPSAANPEMVGFGDVVFTPEGQRCRIFAESRSAAVDALIGQTFDCFESAVPYFKAADPHFFERQDAAILRFQGQQP